MLDSFLAGYNVTILAYGQTGSGKTFTMGSEAGQSNLIFFSSNQKLSLNPNLALALALKPTPDPKSYPKLPNCDSTLALPR